MTGSGVFNQISSQRHVTSQKITDVLDSARLPIPFAQPIRNLLAIDKVARKGSGVEHWRDWIAACQRRSNT
jgi:hypothetical protein